MTDTQNPGGWLDAARPGVPLEPERDRWHWLRSTKSAVEPHEWLGSEGEYPHYNGTWNCDFDKPADAARAGMTYLGPCLTPAEVAAREAAARREGIEAAEIAAHNAIHDAIEEMGECSRVKAAATAAIRALLEDGR